MIPVRTMSIPIQNKDSRLLIWGKDDTSQDYLSYLLGRYHHVETVLDGNTALQSLKSHCIDVLLLDIDDYDEGANPPLNSLLEQLQQDNIAVILFGSISTPDAIAQLLQSGANDYIIKPVEAPIILARVNTQLKMKRLIDERQAAIDAMQHADAIRRQLSRIASHDLKNPLHNLRLAEHLLREEMSNSPDAFPILNMIDLTLDTMQRLIEDFVDMVDLHDDEITFQSEVVAWRDVVINVLMQYEITASDKQIDLKLDHVDGFIVADQARMIQSFSNLVSNAIKYSPKGSCIRIWSEQVEGTWRLCIADKGPGIPKAERHRLFEEFGKLSTRPTGGEPSTGLGLWIVKHLVNKQGGQVGVDFPDAGGSVFWLAMPIYEVSTEEIA